MNEAYIKWGDTILYSTDMSANTEALRIAYVDGNLQQGLKGGYYVWLGDMLIGEALGENGNPIDGITITNGTGENVTIGNLALDSTGSWAPTTNGFIQEALIITGDNSGPLAPGMISWVTERQCDAYNANASIGSTIRSSIDNSAGAEGKIVGGVISSGKATNGFIVNNGDYTGDIWLTITGTPTVNSSRYNGLHKQGTLTGSAYLRISNITNESSWGTVFGGVNGTAVTGDLYMEFSADNVTYVGGTYNGVVASIAGSYRTNIGGTIRMVFNDGTFDKFVYGGCINAAAEVTIGHTALYLNGGTFKSGIFAGGTKGTITGNTSLTITGNATVVHNGTEWGEINAGGQGDGGRINGTSTVTIADLTAGEAEFGFDKFAGKLSGGANVDGTKTLLFKNTQLDSFQAQLENFDHVELTGGSKLALDSLGGATKLTVDDTSELELTGTEYNLNVSNSGTIVLKGGTTLNVTGVGDENIAGGFHVQGGSLNLGNVTTSNGVNVTSGSVSGIGAGYKGILSIDADGHVDMNGTNGQYISQLNTSTATTVTGITGDVTVRNSTLTMGTDSLNNAVLGIDGTFNVTGDLTLAVDNDLLKHLKSLGTGEHDVTLHVTSGHLQVGGMVQLTQTVGVKVDAPSANNDGTVTFTCGTKVIFNASDTQGSISGYDGEGVMNQDGTSNFISTVIDENLAVSLPGAAAPGYADGFILNNIEGKADTTLTLQNTATDGSTALVTLNNHQFEGNTGADSHYLGNIAATGTDVVKKGEGTLTVSGQVSIGADGNGTLRVEEGTLVLDAMNGKHAVHALTLGTDGTLDLQNGSNLTLSSDLDLTEGTLTSSDGKGTLTMDGTDMTIGADAHVEGIAVNLNNAATLTLDGNAALSALNGDARSSLKGSGDLEISGGEGSFLGDLSGYDGMVSVVNGARQRLQGRGGDNTSLLVNNGELTLITGDGGSTYKRLVMGAPALLKEAAGAESAHILNIDMTGGTTGGTVTLTGGATFYDGSIINVALAPSYTDAAILASGNGSVISFDGDTQLNLLITGDSLGNILANGIVLGSSRQLDHTESITVNLVGFEGVLIERDGNWVVDVKRNDGFTYTQFARSGNAAAAGGLIDAAVNRRPGADTMLGKVTTAVDTLVLAGDMQGVSTLMASAAGTTVTALGAAQRTALRDQMGVIRNRLVNPGLNDAVFHEDLPYVHFWAQATGNYSRLNSAGDESGYTLDSWGGTVGLDLDVTEHVNLGVAFTASYGDLKADGAEHASGDLDAYYVNLFSKVKVRRWTHKGIATLGLTDDKLNRTVALPTESYTAKGSTNGTGVGFMYELTYDTYLNEDDTAILQPLLNLSIVNSHVDGYTETNAGNAGLNVGRQTMTTGTIALGLRAMGELSTNALGRSAFGEFRVNIAQDMGDSRSSADVAFSGAPGATASMQGAKIGKTAFQIGAGLNVPIEENSSIYFDVNADFRAHATSVNGSVGYRYDF